MECDLHDKFSKSDENGLRLIKSDRDVSDSGLILWSANFEAIMSSDF